MTSGGAASRISSARSSRAAEIRHQHLDAGRRRELAHGADAVDEVLRTAVLEVVAVDRGDHHVVEPECRDRAAEIARLLGIERLGPAVRDIAERAAARALVAHDHECRRAVAEALADVRARGFLAHGVQPVLAQDVLDLVEARRRRAGAYPDPLRLAQRRRLGDDAQGKLLDDRRRLGLALLLGERVGAGGRGTDDLGAHAIAGDDDRVAGERWAARRWLRRLAASAHDQLTPSVARSTVCRPA